MKYSILQIDGGIGKNIMATAVCQSIKEAYPEHELLVITGYPEIFVLNPFVHKVFKFGVMPYFHNDYIKDNEVLFFVDEPYRSNSFLNQNKHLIQSWCDLLQIENKQEKGLLYFNSEEIECTKSLIQTQKPILLFQPFGGGDKSKNPNKLYSWNRDIPLHQAQVLVNELSKQYYVVQVSAPEQPTLENAQKVSLPLRQLISLPLFAEKILGIDSFLQHASACLNKNATVCWVTNKPEVFGYELHNNITPKEEIFHNITNVDIDGGILKYDFTGGRNHDYPFKTNDIFDINEILNAL